MKTDHWFYGLFQSAPDLIALLLPKGATAAPSLGPDAPGDVLYRFEAPELKAANHRLDGVIWLSLEELGQQTDLDPLLNLLTLPVRPEDELKLST